MATNIAEHVKINKHGIYQRRSGLLKYGMKNHEMFQEVLCFFCDEEKFNKHDYVASWVNSNRGVFNAPKRDSPHDFTCICTKRNCVKECIVRHKRSGLQFLTGSTCIRQVQLFDEKDTADPAHFWKTYKDAESKEKERIKQDDKLRELSNRPHNIAFTCGEMYEEQSKSGNIEWVLKNTFKKHDMLSLQRFYRQVEELRIVQGLTRQEVVQLLMR